MLTLDECERELTRLDRRIMAIEVVPLRMAAMEVEITGLAADVAEVKKMILDRAEQRLQERDTSARDRKSDRRWLVGTVGTAASLVIAAMAILLPSLNGTITFPFT